MVELGKGRTGIVSHPDYMKHKPGAWHPECPERYEAVHEGIKQLVDADKLVQIAPRKATIEQIGLCHTPDYIKCAREEIQSGCQALSTGDTDVSAESYDIALLAAGGVLAGVDAVFSGKVRNAFCVVRPPGHHATADKGMGFCIFNNIAIGARYSQQAHGVERVAIVDWDVHHGNGTQDIFYDDSSVFYFSTHQWPCYPGTGSPRERGAGLGVGATLNRPVSPGSGRTEVFEAFEQAFLPAMKTFKPDLIMISAGFDARKEEPISDLELEDEDFGDLTTMVMGVASRDAGGRVISVLEGGYGLAGLATAAGTHVRRLTEQD